MISAVGWVGALLVSGAYLLVTLRGEFRWYHPLNAVGGFGLMLHASAHDALPSAAVNALWGVIALIGWQRRIRQVRARKGSA